MTDPIKAKREAQRLFWDQWWRSVELKAARRLAEQMTPLEWADRYKYEPGSHKPRRRMDA